MDSASNYDRVMVSIEVAISRITSFLEAGWVEKAQQELDLIKGLYGQIR